MRIRRLEIYNIITIKFYEKIKAEVMPTGNVFTLTSRVTNSKTASVGPCHASILAKSRSLKDPQKSSEMILKWDPGVGGEGSAGKTIEPGVVSM